MEIKLNWIRVENFKGIKNFLFEPKSKDTNVYGDNATCKTSLEDAWRWLLFNKDSTDREDTNFDIKPQDKDGKDVMGTESLVEAELLVDGKPLRLKKIRVEKWTKRQGTGEVVFDGHQRKYWFDEEPMGARKYQEKLAELITEDTFKMITNPLYFNTQVDWRKRLEILFEIYIKETDEEIMLSNPNISRLAEILDGKTVESYEKILKDKIKNLKKEKEDLPPRIDEIIKSLPQEEPGYTAIENELKKHKEELTTVEFLMTSATNKANELNKKHQELYSLKLKLEETKSRIKSEVNGDRQELTFKHGELFNGVNLLQQNIGALKSQIESYVREIKYGEDELAKLREDWKSLSEEKANIVATEFKGEVDGTCPTCRQALPTEDIETELEKLKTNFENNKKSQVSKIDIKLSNNSEEGKSKKSKVEQAKEDKELVEKELAEKNTKLEQLRVELVKTEEELSKPIPEPDYTKYPEMTKLSTKIDNLAYELDKPVEDKSAELLQQKTEIQAKIDECNKTLNGKEEVEKKKERIEFLKDEEKRISNLMAELEGHNFLIDEFYLIKTEMVNKNFEHVRFRFFEENDTNDGRKKMCVAEVNTNGSYVKFEDANTAGQVNAGLDIINILCDFYGVRAPIFVDNAERVTTLIDTESQLIRLVKPEIRNEEDRKKFSQLVVEVQE